MQTVGDDVLEGAEAIGKFIGVNRRRAHYLLERHEIPAGKVGSRWVASKSALTEHYARITRGEQESAA